MISGVAVVVHRPNTSGVDRLNNPIEMPPTHETVNNVLVAPGATEDLAASRPEGVSVAYTLHFPKSYIGDLEGCSVTLPQPWGGDYAIVGKPGRYIDKNTPTAWDMAVEVAAAHG